ncbi:MAG: hypothetical protein WC325_13175 [Candidatus Bathyarchaeia archaeon]|jgi:hypothetical protein
MLRKLKNDKSGVGWVLGVAILCLLFMPVVYFPLSYAWDNVYAVFTGSYVFTGITASALTVVELIIDYLLVFGLLFTINWAIVQAKSKRYSP